MFRFLLPPVSRPGLRMILAAALGAALVSQALSAAAQTIPRQVVSVDRDQIVLGDIFLGIDDPARARAVVARAPAPGEQTSFGVAWLERVAENNGLLWTPGSRSDRVVIERAARIVPDQTVRQAVRTALAAASEADAIEMRLGGRALDMTLPTDTPATIDVRNLSFDRNSGRFEALVVAPAQGPTATSLRVAGRATPKVDVPVLRRGLARGDVIGIDDIAWTSIAANRLYSGAIQSPRELVGMTARRNLRAHQPIRGNDIEKPVVIERGETVTLVLLHQGMQLTAQARALEDGAAGENIRLVNTTSSRTLTGRVRPNGAVVVSLPGADPAQM